MKKKKPKAKKKAKIRGSGKKASRKSATAKGKEKTGPVSAVAATDLTAAVAPADDPIGACYWVDASGQNHCKVTTQSLCKNNPGSSFYPGKQCA
jgi:hypothetical protein